MLDNMDGETLISNAKRLKDEFGSKHKFLLESSGGIDIDNVQQGGHVDHCKYALVANERREPNRLLTRPLRLVSRQPSTLSLPARSISRQNMSISRSRSILARSRSAAIKAVFDAVHCNSAMCRLCAAPSHGIRVATLTLSGRFRSHCWAIRTAGIYKQPQAEPLFRCNFATAASFAIESICFSTMTSNASTILARIDELMLDLVRQLASRAEALSSTPSTASSQPNAEPAAKRSKSTPTRITPLKLLTFAPTEGGGRGESNISFPTKSIVGMRRFGEPFFFYDAFHPS